MRIYWRTVSTETRPEGGDFIHDVESVLIFDGTISERYLADASATEHPVEMGVDIADHIKVGLRQLTIDAVVSAHPGPSSAANVALTDSDEPTERPAVVREQLEALRVAGTEIEVETPVGFYESLILLGVEEERNADGGDGLHVTLTLREFRRVSTQEVDAPAPRVERARRTTDRGTQQPSSMSGQDSVLAAIANRGENVSILRAFSDSVIGGQSR